MLLPSPFLELIDRGIFLDGRLILFPGAKNPENPLLFLNHQERIPMAQKKAKHLFRSCQNFSSKDFFSSSLFRKRRYHVEKRGDLLLVRNLLYWDLGLSFMAPNPVRKQA